MIPRKKKKRILIIPSIRKGNGSGHLRRSVKLAVEFLEKGVEAAILIDSASHRLHDCYSIEDASLLLPKGRKRRPALLSETVSSDWDICIFDTRETPPQRLSAFSGYTVSLGLDEGGEARKYFDYLIDVLPNLEESSPNIYSPGFLQLPRQPENRKQRPIEKVLISFGGEDASDLTGKVIEMIDDTGIFELSNITVVKGPFFKHRSPPEAVEMIDVPDNLSEMLKDYDLVFTMFGLTCFEALYSMTPVILLNPSIYHRNLSVRAGIPEIGINKPDAGKLEKYLAASSRIYRAVDTYSGISRLNLADYIIGLDINQQKCRGCGRKHHKIIFRSREYSFFKCSNCGLVNKMYFGTEQMCYGQDYFFDDYKKQYGRTYLEDFEQIKSEGLRRCSLIKRYKKSGILLDVGCGYGPFLSAAADSGFTVYGIDISKEAAEWVSSELGFTTLASSIEDFDPKNFGVREFDAITMWFVIEHLKELPGILAKINLMLSPEGVFAFSTPNYNGISRLKKGSSFIASNPFDHYTIWSPFSARRLLKKYGFRVKTIKCPIIHPERFFSAGVYKRLPAPLRAAIGRLVAAAGQLFLFGDTFEVYAVKKKDFGDKFEN